MTDKEAVELLYNIILTGTLELPPMGLIDSNLHQTLFRKAILTHFVNPNTFCELEELLMVGEQLKVLDYYWDYIEPYIRSKS